LESSKTVIVVTASLKEDERGGQGHTSTNLLHQSATSRQIVTDGLEKCTVFRIKAAFEIQFSQMHVTVIIYAPLMHKQ
jgi:hypothetical protein